MKSILMPSFFALSLFVFSCNKQEPKSEVKVDGQKEMTTPSSSPSSSSSSKYEGSYIKGEKGDGYYEELILKNVGGDKYNVKVNYGGSPKGCQFEANGVLVNDKIIVDLNSVKKDFTSKLWVLLSENKAEITSDTFDNRFDLQYFCGGGASLMGDFIKNAN